MLELENDKILPLMREHGFWTWSAQKKVNPIPVVRAKGVHFWDTDGKRYLDFSSMTMCVNAGHGDERIINAMKEQLDTLPYAAPAMATKIRSLAGKALAEITPEGINHFLFTLGGADANENAMRLARAYTGKEKILARYRSYHGATTGAMSATGDPRKHEWQTHLMPIVVHFLDPHRYRSTFHRTTPDISEEDFCLDYLNHLEEIIMYEGRGTIAAIILEPVTGKNGIIIPPKGYLQGVREICDKYNIMMIVDEVMTGFGRTGAWFAVDNWDVRPDLITMAKGLTSAYAPLGAVGMTDEIAAHFDEYIYNSGLTYTAHPVSLAALLANIHVLREDKLIERSASLGSSLSRMLSELKEKHPSVGDVRSIGLFGVIEIVRNQETKEPMSLYNRSSPEIDAFKKYCFEHGLYLSIHWQKAFIIPPLVITEEQLAEGIAIIDEALKITDKAVNTVNTDLHIGISRK